VPLFAEGELGPHLIQCGRGQVLPPLVYSGQTVGWIKMKLGMAVGLCPFHIVLDGDPAALPKTGTQQPPLFGPCLCGQTAGWIKMQLGTEVDLDPGHIVSDVNPAPH